MKIQQLLEREPFGAIVERTLVRYFDEMFDEPHRVAWRGSAPRPNGSSGSAQLWCCNPWLNVLFVPDVKPALLRLIRTQYVVTPFLLRGPFQRAYVTLATSPRLARQFSRLSMQVTPTIPGAENLLLLGGNNRLRLIDFDRGIVCSILKDGFDSAYLEREIAVRLRSGDWPIPKLIKAAADSSWFEEAYVDGVALNRVSGGRPTAELEGAAMSILYTWLNTTRTDGEVEQYIEEICSQAQEAIGAVPLLSHEDRGRLLRWLGAARRTVAALVPGAGKILPLAVGHGDFQAGNIIISHGRLWLIDWEHSAQRQFLYDPLVYTLRSRFPRNLAARLEALLADWDSHGSVGLGWPEARSLNPAGRRLVLAVFLLEELCWYLKETGNPVLTALPRGWLAFEREMERGLAIVARTS